MENIKNKLTSTLSYTATNGGYLKITQNDKELAQIYVPPPFFKDKYSDTINESYDDFNDFSGNFYSIYIWSALGDITYSIKLEDKKNEKGYYDFLTDLNIEYIDAASVSFKLPSNPITITIPKSVYLPAVINIVNETKSHTGYDEYIFDFKNVQWMTPFSQLYLSNNIYNFIKETKAKVTFINHEHQSYLAHMGFFESCGISYGKKPNEASGNNTYLPIRKINIEKLKQEAIDNFEHVGEVITNHADALAKMLTQNENEDIQKTLQFSIREIMRNVIEHSNAKNIVYCAQYWPSKHQVEIAILDEGVGLAKSLSNNPHISITSDSDAVKFSLMPGISGKMFEGVKKRKDDFWQNSGYGLYMTNRICRNGGNFFICSGTCGMLLTPTNKKYFDTNFQGTAVRLFIDTSKLSSVATMLGQFRDEGITFAKRHPIANLTPSEASTMLSNDFENI